ncbi:MAG: hypothetical protein QXU81_03145 [Candidatus Bathyarchaeia archaeon]
MTIFGSTIIFSSPLLFTEARPIPLASRPLCPALCPYAACHEDGFIISVGPHAILC